jgi:hypothetical protein
VSTIEIVPESVEVPLSTKPLIAILLTSVTLMVVESVAAIDAKVARASEIDSVVESVVERPA